MLPQEDLSLDKILSSTRQARPDQVGPGVIPVAQSTEPTGNSRDKPELQVTPASEEDLKELRQLALEARALDDMLVAAVGELGGLVKKKKGELKKRMLKHGLRTVDIAGRKPLKLKPTSKKDTSKGALGKALGSDAAAAELWKKLPLKESFSVILPEDQPPD